MPEMGAPEEMQHLAFLAGTWDVEFRHKFDPTATDWIVEEATTVSEMILDGCFVRSQFTGSMMGMPFKGVEILGYDRETEQWQATWMDNMGARISFMQGERKDDGSIVMTGTDYMQGMPMQVRYVISEVTDTSYEWSMEVSMDGENYNQVAGATYTKK